MRWRLLGPVEVSAAGRVLPLARPQQRGVLSYLLLNANRVVPTEQLIDALWGDAPAATARTQVHACVSQIRRVLRESVGDTPLTSHPVGYRIAVADGELDGTVFAEQVSGARSAAADGDPCRAADLLRAGLALWRGPALTGARGAFVEAAVARLEEQRLAAYEDLAEAELALGRHSALVTTLQPVVDANPLRERLIGQLMLALAAGGQQSQALRLYGEARARLADEFGMEPGPQLAEAHLRVLRQQLTSPLPARAGAPTSPAQLPPETAFFTGRADQLDALDAVLNGAVAKGPRTAVVSGTAGVGKTALAVRWAHRVAGRFPDGQLYVNLRGYAPGPPLPPIDAAGVLLRSLGSRPDQVPVDLAEAAGLLRSMLAGRRVLVVLDNARSAEQVRPLLPGSAGCFVLVTSRDRLAGLVARDGARRITLDVLSPPEARILLARVIDEQRVRAEPEAAAELAAACAYLPLALRIAAAKLTHHPHRNMAEHVAELRHGNRLAALTIENDEEAAVRTTLDLSYRSVPADARRMFRLLGLVPGTDFTAGAAAALTGSTPLAAAPLLDQLAAAHLISEHAPDRFTFHDLLRQYAKERADRGGESAEALRRLFNWYLCALDSAAQQLYADLARLPLPAMDPRPPGIEFRDGAEAGAWLDAERHNLVTAVRHGPGEMSWLLADGLRGYLAQRDHMVDWIATARSGLAAARAAAEPNAQAAMHQSLAQTSLWLGRPDEATEHLTHAIEMSGRGGWRSGLSAAINNLGIVYYETGRTEEAIGQFTKRIEMARHDGLTLVLSSGLNNLGIAYHTAGRLPEAADSLAEAVRLSDPNHWGRGAALDSLAGVYHNMGRYLPALALAKRALAIHRRNGNRYHQAATLNTIADIQLSLGDHRQAHDLAQASVTLAEGIRTRRIEANALNLLGAVHQARGEQTEAVRRYEQAMSKAHDTDFSYTYVVTLIGLATAHGGLGDHGMALEHARQARAIAVERRLRLLEGRALTALAELQLGAGDREEATRCGHEALESHRKTGHRPGEARTLVALAEAAADGEPYRREALDLFASLGVTAPGPPSGFVVTA